MTDLLEKPEGFCELHEQALSVLTTEYQGYKEIKPLIDKLTDYHTDSNGAMQILSNLLQWGFIEEKREDILWDGKYLRGQKHFFKLAGAV